MKNRAHQVSKANLLRQPEYASLKSITINLAKTLDSLDGRAGDCRQCIRYLQGTGSNPVRGMFCPDMRRACVKISNNWPWQVNLFTIKICTNNIATNTQVFNGHVGPARKCIASYLGVFIYFGKQSLMFQNLFFVIQQLSRSWNKNTQPPVRIELTTPGLQDQCSNP